MTITAYTDENFSSEYKSALELPINPDKVKFTKGIQYAEDKQLGSLNGSNVYARYRPETLYFECLLDMTNTLDDDREKKPVHDVVNDDLIRIVNGDVSSVRHDGIVYSALLIRNFEDYRIPVYSLLKLVVDVICPISLFLYALLTLIFLSLPLPGTGSDAIFCIQPVPYAIFNLSDKLFRNFHLRDDSFFYNRPDMHFFYNNRHNFYSLRSNRLQFRVTVSIASPLLAASNPLSEHPIG